MIHDTRYIKHDKSSPGRSFFSMALLNISKCKLQWPLKTYPCEKLITVILSTYFCGDTDDLTEFKFPAFQLSCVQHQNKENVMIAYKTKVDSTCVKSRMHEKQFQVIVGWSLCSNVNSWADHLVQMLIVGAATLFKCLPFNQYWRHLLNFCT